DDRFHAFLRFHQMHDGSPCQPFCSSRNRTARLGLSASARTVGALHGDYSETWRVMNYSRDFQFTRESLSGATGVALARVLGLYLPIEVEPEVSPRTPMS